MNGDTPQWQLIMAWVGPLIGVLVGAILTWQYQYRLRFLEWRRDAYGDVVACMIDAMNLPAVPQPQPDNDERDRQEYAERDRQEWAEIQEKIAAASDPDPDVLRQIEASVERNTQRIERNDRLIEGYTAVLETRQRLMHALGVVEVVGSAPARTAANQLLKESITWPTGQTSVQIDEFLNFLEIVRRELEPRRWWLLWLR